MNPLTATMFSYIFEEVSVRQDGKCTLLANKQWDRC